MAFAVAYVLFGSAGSPPAEAAGRVELVLTTDRHAPLTAQQAWARELGAAGVRNVRLRTAHASDKVGIETRGAKESPLYIVTGTLDSHGEVILPEGRYRQGEAKRIAHWLDELARLGPPETREPVVAFGLKHGEMLAVRDDLATPIGFSTKGLPRGEAARKILDGLRLPVELDPKLLPTDDADRVADELRGLSCGSGLACVLRPLGLVLVPRSTPSKGPIYRITPARGEKEVWPVGWKPEKSGPKIVPKMIDFFWLELPGVQASRALDAIVERLQIPVLIDHHALAHHKIDLEKAIVTIPRTRMTYASALDRVLFQAKVKSELRTDEADSPFLWITTIKPAK
ncbi:MAG TPA: hypothetical protein DD670_16245 [Planctomycetaceae bacterium]|nr:hypothetical protein [Planctomycetaceae bacterium]